MDEQLEKFLQTRSGEDLEAAVIHFMPLVQEAVAIQAKMNGVSNHPESDDVRSDATLGLLRAIKRFKTEMHIPFVSYARRMISFRVLDGIRRRARRQCIEEVETVPLKIDMPEEPFDPDSLSDSVEICCRFLPPKIAPAFRLKYLQGLTNQEIGERLGISTSLAGQRVRQARIILQRSSNKAILEDALL